MYCAAGSVVESSGMLGRDESRTSGEVEEAMLVKEKEVLEVAADALEEVETAREKALPL